jgi:ABC-2 type transport system permease protein
MKRKLSFDPNPIIVKELRSRMRGSRAFTTLTLVLVVLGLFSYALYHLVISATRYSGMPLSPQIGQVMFFGLAMVELLLISAITPAITASAISGEREKLTYEMLLATPLHPLQILWGKLFSSLSYVLILLFAAIPMASLVFIFGGVTLRDMLKTLAVLIVAAVLFGVIGLFMSALLGRSGRSIAFSYAVVLLILFGPLLAALFASILNQGEPPRWLLVPCPISALGSAMDPSVNLSNLSSLFWMLGSTFWVFGGSPISMSTIPRPLYHYSLPLYGLIILLLYLLSTRLVLPTQRWRIQWSQALIGLVLVLGYLGLVSIAFFSTANRYENAQIITPTPVPEVIEPVGSVLPEPVGAGPLAALDVQDNRCRMKADDPWQC